MTRLSTLRYVEYRIIVIDPASRNVLAFRLDGMWRLPRLTISQGARPSPHIQAAMESMWGVSVFVVDFLSIDSTEGTCVLAELLREPTSDSLAAARTDELDPAEFREAERACLQRIVAGEVASPIGRIGWVDEAIAWVEDTTGERGLSKCNIEQHNAGGGFALLRMQTLSGRSYWLKATCFPNTHERTVTLALARICHSHRGCNSYVPTLVAERADWNAWLMEESASPQPIPEDEVESLKVVCDIASALAVLQQATVPYTAELLSSGAGDHRYAHLRVMTPALFAYLRTVLEELEDSSSSGAERLHFLEEASLNILERLEASPVPTSVVHADLNWGNILLVPHPQFIDWSETYIGNPATSLHQLTALFQSTHPRLSDRLGAAARDAYLSAWGGFSLADWHDNLHYARVTSLLTLLFGRFGWISCDANTRRFDGIYLRSLIDRLYEAITSRNAVAA
jgi:hypothetical protein